MWCLLLLRQVTQGTQENNILGWNCEREDLYREIKSTKKSDTAGHLCTSLIILGEISE